MTDFKYDHLIFWTDEYIFEFFTSCIRDSHKLLLGPIGAPNWSNDNAQLWTALDFTGGTIGYAAKGWFSNQATN